MMTPRKDLPEHDLAFRGFEQLMPRRIKNILMVASLYDSFLIADDERLTEALFSELAEAPRITRVSTAEEAALRLATGDYDLVIAMVQLGDTDMREFAAGIREQRPGLPIVLLSFNMQDVLNISPDTRALVDGVFLWHGDTAIFSAIINLMEDAVNFESDSKAGVQAVLLVEDNVRFYSSYLPVIYSELMKQTQIVMADELNPSKKMLRLKARPKVLLADNFDEAWKIYSRYKTNLLGVISDIEYPVGEKCDPEAGLNLARRIKEESPDMPVLLQSSNSAMSRAAGELGASFLHKSSKDLGRQLRGFILRYFGFGEFIFSDPQGNELARAADLQGMIKLLKAVPLDSIYYHAERNHFSKWLFARTEFEIAYHIRPKRISEFRDREELRKYLIETLYQFVHRTQLGTVLKFDRRLFDDSTPFVKIGSGSIGGKARGLAFVDFLLSREDFREKFPGVDVKTPNTIVLATDVFDFFMEQNGLDAQLSDGYSNERVAQLFEAAKLPDFLIEDLKAIVAAIDGPIAVRSSSLLEDSKTQPFAGIYKTYMLANNHPDPEVRLEQLRRAIKYVYASTFSREARAYRRFSPHLPDEEKMAVIIQKVVGRTHSEGGRHYPDFAGVVQSYNYYPVPPLEAEEPIAHIALGLGKTIVEGHNALRFSPAHPRNLHQFSTIKDFLGNSQKKFAALDLKKAGSSFTYEKEPDLSVFGLDAAASDGTLELVGSTYSRENDAVVDSLSADGPKLVTFAPVLKSEVMPLSALLAELSDLGSEAMGSNIEMEFAGTRDPETGRADFCILQMRPMVSRTASRRVDLSGVAPEKVICSSGAALGNGEVKGVRDIVYVRPDAFSPARTRDIADQISGLNRLLQDEGRPYLLIGPGRWGSSDPFLGVPVSWHQISGSRVIVEASYGDFSVDPSYGTHFFHNVTSLGLGYLTINSFRKDGGINWEWLESQPLACETAFVRHLRLEKPLDIRIDGYTGRGLAALP